MDNRSKIEIIQTGTTTANVIINGKQLRGVSGYTIEHTAGGMAKLEIIMGKPYSNEIQIDEICEVSIRYEDE